MLKSVFAASYFCRNCDTIFLCQNVKQHLFEIETLAPISNNDPRKYPHL